MSFLNCLNKKNRVIILMLCVFVFANFVYAEDRILNLVLVKDESGIRILDRTVSISKIESEGTNLSGYKFVIRGSDNNFIETINFGFRDNIAIVSFPVNLNFVRGEIYDIQDNLMLEIDLYSHIDLNICGDNTCSGDETYESCPGDCFLQREILEKETKNESKLLLIILYSAIGVVGFLIIIFSFMFLKNKLKSKKIELGRNIDFNVETGSPLEQQLQEYIQNALKQGLSEDEIEDELLKNGWPIELIEKYLK